METQQAVTALAALAQESRLRIFRLLVQAGPKGLAVGEIGASLEISPATLSFHLKELAQAGLAKTRQEGRFVYYSPDFEAMNRLLGYLTENCCAREASGCGPGCGPREATPTPQAKRKNHVRTQ